MENEEMEVLLDRQVLQEPMVMRAVELLGRHHEMAEQQELR